MKIGFYENNIHNTIGTMKRFAIEYASDTDLLLNKSLKEFFYFVSNNIKYVSDPPGFEFVMRPAVLLKRGGGDCDDKAVLSCAWFVNKNITTGYSVVSQHYNKPMHHVFSFFIDDKGKKFDFDATYNNSEYLKKRKWAHRKDILIYKKV